MAITVQSKDMTKGSISKHLIAFAFPLLIGNLFQQLYNTVDTWIVGNYVSTEAFSAIGSAASVINVVIGFFLGFSTGAGVIVSQCFGAKKQDKLQRAVSTSILMTLFLSILFTVVGYVTVPGLLRLMKVPQEVWNDSLIYLQIFMLGIAGTLFYNVGSGILRAVGNSVLPFIFLVIGTVLNIGLDFWFVLYLRMGVSGVAYATVISQAVTAVLSLAAILLNKEITGSALRHFTFDMDHAREIIRIGLPTGFQGCAIAISNVFVQAYINSLGVIAMSGWTAYYRISQFFELPGKSIGMAETTFAGQNYGSGDIDRIKKSMGRAITILWIVMGAILIPVLLFSPQLVQLLNKDPEVVVVGALIFRTVFPFTLLAGTAESLLGIMRGTGNARVPMIISFGTHIVVRQVYLYIVTGFISNSVVPVMLCFPFGWSLCALISIPVSLQHVRKLETVNRQ